MCQIHYSKLGNLWLFNFYTIIRTLSINFYSKLERNSKMNKQFVEVQTNGLPFNSALNNESITYEKRKQKF